MRGQVNRSVWLRDAIAAKLGDETVSPELVKGVICVYRLYDEGDRLLYVGVTSSLFTRLANHASLKLWWSEVAGITFERYPDRETADVAEKQAIADEQPVYNGTGTDHAAGPSKGRPPSSCASRTKRSSPSTTGRPSSGSRALVSSPRCSGTT